MELPGGADRLERSGFRGFLLGAGIMTFDVSVMFPLLELEIVHGPLLWVSGMVLVPHCRYCMGVNCGLDFDTWYDMMVDQPYCAVFR